MYGRPNDEAIARVLALVPKGKQRHFNYRMDTKSRWAEEEADFACQAQYGDDENGLTVTF